MATAMAASVITTLFCPLAEGSWVVWPKKWEAEMGSCWRRLPEGWLNCWHGSRKEPYTGRDIKLGEFTGH